MASPTYIRVTQSELDALVASRAAKQDTFYILPSGIVYLGQITGKAVVYTGAAVSPSTYILTSDNPILVSQLSSFLLPTLNPSPAGTYGNSTTVPVVTVNAKGLVTAVSAVAIAGTPPGGPAGGDLSGTYPNPTVAQINGNPLGSTIPTSGNILIAGGASWVSQSMSGDATLNSTGLLTLATVNTNTGTWGSSTQVPQFTVNGKGLITAVSNVAISITGLGQSLTKTDDTNVTLTLGGSPNTSLVNAASITVGWTGTLADARLSTTGVTAATYGSATQVPVFAVTATGRITSVTNTTISGVSPGGSAGGDLSGTYPNPTVAKINTATLGTTTATNKNILIADGSAWQSVAVSGDITITANTGTFTLATVNANVGTFGSATQSAQVTVNAKGLVTAASNVTITPAASSITGGQNVTAGSSKISLGGTPTAAALLAFSIDVTEANLTLNNIGGTLGLSKGGTNAALTASVGGIFYSTASAGAILSGTATANKMLLSGASAAPTWSTSTIPSSAGVTANKVLLSDGTNYVLSTPTFPNASATAGKLIVSDGTNWVESTPTYPNASATSGKFIQSDGTNFIASTLALPTSSTANQIVYSTATSTYGGSANFLYNGTGTSGGLVITNTTGGTTYQSWLDLVGSTADNSNLPGIRFKSGTTLSAYPFIGASSSGQAIEMTCGTGAGLTHNPRLFMFVSSSAALGYIQFMDGSTQLHRFTMDGNVSWFDGSTWALGTTTGTKIGTATSQKIGFWNATPIVQPTTGVAAATFTANSGTAVNDASTFDGYTLKQIVKALRNIGLLA